MASAMDDGTRSSSLSIRPDSKLLPLIGTRSPSLSPHNKQLHGWCRRTCCGWGAWTCRRRTCCVLLLILAAAAAAGAGIGIAVYVLRWRWPGLPPPCTVNCVHIDHSEWTKALQQFTFSGNLAGYRNLTVVRYTALRAIISAGLANPLDNYTAMIARVDLARLNDTERKALFLNAYNVFAMSKLLDNSCDGQLCDSIHDIGNFVCPVWYQKAGVVGGRSFSLDNIEDDYLTTHFHDARVHGGMNCASMSCPNLRREAYESQTLNRQLDEQMVKWLSAPKRAFHLDTQTNSLSLNEIFYWDASQFRPSVLQFLAPFAPSGNGSYIVAHENDLHVSYFPYDWARNGI